MTRRRGHAGAIWPRAVYNRLQPGTPVLHYSRNSAAKFAFVILAVAVGVGSLTGVRGFSRAFRSMLLKDARTLMAADLSVRVFELPTPAQQKFFDDFTTRSIDRTWITETVSMLSAPQMSAPLLVAVKAVDPAKYPFYGQVTTANNASLPSILEGAGIAVSDDLLVRSGLKEGANVGIVATGTKRRFRLKS